MPERFTHKKLHVMWTTFQSVANPNPVRLILQRGCRKSDGCSSGTESHSLSEQAGHDRLESSNMARHKSVGLFLSKPTVKYFYVHGLLLVGLLLVPTAAHSLFPLLLHLHSMSEVFTTS